MRRARRNRARSTGILFLLCTATTAFAATGTINSADKYAWGNVAGWVNFAPSQSAINVSDSSLSGYVWSSNDGWINLAPAQGGVTNDGHGNLGGFAWDSVAGWVSFSGVTIGADGSFHGKAIGGMVEGASYAINFDCARCSVITTWRVSGSRTNGSSVPATDTGAIVTLVLPPVTPTAVEPPAGSKPTDIAAGNPPAPSGSTTYPQPPAGSKPPSAIAPAASTAPSHGFSLLPYILGGFGIVGVFVLLIWFILRRRQA